MRSEFVQIVFLALMLVFGGAAEELLPHWFGVGFPVLLAAVQFVAARWRSAYVAILFAVAAGAMEDSLSSLPAMTGVGYFLLTAVLVRWAQLPAGAAALTYPVFQIWLYLWVSGLQGGVFNRILLALPIGLATELLLWPLLVWTERKAAIDGKG